ncbi:ribbon-helix-helix domain-containing protein [Clostridium felsineum]|uniref:ribbon-helix-helix domain-containing protein n=1 Tax=Clostridium felsineum TaxID=36839 RepID=UPI00214D3A14|nr:ribbon-helix-helix domain-containing protein [Clostridium felsineum]
MKNNFKESIKNNIKTEVSESKEDLKEDLPEVTVAKDGKFKISKKKDEKSIKKTFNLYMNENLVKELDQICKKTGYSRNELINKMCDFCVNNIDFE